MNAGGVVVDVVQLWAALVPAGDHGAHTEAVSAILVHGVGKQLGSGSHRDALLVAQLVDAALAAQVALPVLAVRRAARHGAEQEGVDLNHFLHALRGCVCSDNGIDV